MSFTLPFPQTPTSVSTYHNGTVHSVSPFYQASPVFCAPMAIGTILSPGTPNAAILRASSISSHQQSGFHFSHHFGVEREQQPLATIMSDRDPESQVCLPLVPTPISGLQLMSPSDHRWKASHDLSAVDSHNNGSQRLSGPRFLSRHDSTVSSAFTAIEPGSKRHTCADCGQTLKKASTLAVHRRTHTGERPYECGRAFATGSDLIKHTRTHTGERPYQCTVQDCNKAFSTASNLRVHERVHTGEKPYQCQICYRQFAQAGSLSRHFLIHSGVRRFSCDICEKKFTQSNHLRAHRDRVHGRKPDEN